MGTDDTQFTMHHTLSVLQSVPSTSMHSTKRSQNAEHAKKKKRKYTQETVLPITKEGMANKLQTADKFRY